MILWAGADCCPTQREPTALDALVYALLSIVLRQPSATNVPLKDRLERCPTLLKWIETRNP